jgi:catechol 2,3-dioxygenase-like lactoylglutathione lyase family enzyme
MIDHVTLRVKDFQRSHAFYEEALAPLGYRAVQQFDDAAGYGRSANEPTLWVIGDAQALGTVHVAFRAVDAASVDRFYGAALAAGGRDNGPPGFRAHYHPSYYAAFVLDPDGHNIEAVCHDKQPGTSGIR